MPGIHTHLNLAQRLLEKTSVEDPGAFFLGNAYPDRFGESLTQSIALHYKTQLRDACDLSAFLEKEPRDDFSFGYYFHLWVDNYMQNVDVHGIRKAECLVCDLEVITPAIQAATDHAATEKEQQALKNILALEALSSTREPVSGETRKAYEEILNAAVNVFLQTASQWREDYAHR